MAKVEITLSIDGEKLEALNYSLRKENSSVQKKMEQSLAELYEQTVPNELKAYLESRLNKPKRTVRSAAKKSLSGAQSVSKIKEDIKNGQ